MGLFKRKPKDDDLQADLDQAKKEAEGARKALKEMMDQNVESKQMKADCRKESPRGREENGRAGEQAQRDDRGKITRRNG
jgi:hypothetical protein